MWPFITMHTLVCLWDPHQLSLPPWSECVSPFNHPNEVINSVDTIVVLTHAYYGGVSPDEVTVM